MGTRLGTISSFTMSTTSQQTTAFGSYTHTVRIATGAQPGYFSNPAASPTAGSTDSNLIGTNCVDYIRVAPGEKIAVFQAGTAGTITITEMV
jgi:hypothetical protein